MQALDYPTQQDTVRFNAVSALRLQTEKVGDSKSGVYLYPHVVAGDRSASETFQNAVALVIQLRTSTEDLFNTRDKLKRSLSPVTGEFNNGRTGDKQNPTGSVLEKACAAVATVTSDKPAALFLKEMRYTSIIPDLPLDSLMQFVVVFRAMVSTRGNFGMTATYKSDHTPQQRAARTFKRPAICSGNYPNAPRNTEAFGVFGVLAAVGEWARVAQEEQRQKALAVLQSLANCPLYITSYDGIRVAQFSHHIVGLAQTAKLRQIVDDLYFRTRFYDDAEAQLVDRSGNDYRLFF